MAKTTTAAAGTDRAADQTTQAADAGTAAAGDKRMYTVTSVAVRHDGAWYDVGNRELALTDAEAERLGALVSLNDTQA